MTQPRYKEVSAIARRRRDAVLSSFYGDIPSVPPDSDLPQRLNEYPRTSGFFTQAELNIIDSEATEILKNIKERRWTSLEVAKAFCKSAAVAQKLTNCVTEVLFAEALERAQFLDDYQAQKNALVGPLHGLPISLKDCFVTPPHPSSIGIAAFANEALHQETLLVTILRDLGAVCFVKTNVPVAMMMMETVNNVWGETRNPLHKGLSPGGSSGGESALIAMHASPLGVGTDIGGSVRIPSAWCHLYGLKPSFGRFPVWGGKSGIPGQEFILAVSGPMSRSLKSVQLYCETLLSEKISPWNLDHKCLPIPWRKDVIQPAGRKLRLAIVGPDDGLVTCHPPVERALRIAKGSLQRAGHEVVDWPTHDHPTIVKNLIAAFFDLGGGAIMEHLEPYGEPIFGSMVGYAEAAKAGEGDLGPTKMRMMNIKRNQMQKAYLERWMATGTADKGPIDGIIMAAAPWAAARLGITQKALYFGYTGVFNLLDFPACTFPVTRADASIDKPRDLNEWKPLNELDAKIQQDYDPLFYDDAPVSLQLAGKRLEEEKVLEMVEIVSSVLKGIDNKPVDSVTYASPITADSVQDVSGDERSRIQAWQREGGFAVDAKKSGLA